jgi:hypothetical protein
MAHGAMPMPAAPAPHGPTAPKQCTCMGTCCAVALLDLPAGRLIALPVVPVTVAVATTAPSARLAPAAAPDLLLPPPLGPPTLRA